MLNIAGLVYWCVSIALIVAMIFLNPKIKFITNSYFFWLGIAILSFVWVLSFRFIPDWIDYWNNHDWAYANIENLEASKYISRAFMLDACPFFFSLLMISLIADPSRKIARIVAPIAIVGALTAVGTIITYNNGENEDAVFTLQYILFGLGRERCFFIMHWLQLIVGIAVLLNVPKCGWRIWLESIGVFVVYLCYVGIVMAISKCCWFCTGLAMNDYSPEGEYHIVDNALHFPRELWFTYPMILLSILATGGVLALAVSHDCLFSTKWIWKYGNAKSGDKFHYWNYNKFVKEKNKWW